jgi:hypothetical protein
LTTPPADYKPDSGVRPDPFAFEKPLFSINAQNMNQYADKLTDGTKALMKKVPTFRIDVYKTHRTVAFPEYLLKNTAKCAVNATTYNGGLSIKGCRAGYPFPIPKNGYEVMWNHLLRYTGLADELAFLNYIVDANGKLVLSATGTYIEEFPFYDEDATRPDANKVWKVVNYFTGPARRAGEIAYLIDDMNPYEIPRIAYQYLPGQRRIKLAPEFAFDTPFFGSGGANNFDEYFMFNGSMERFDMKLIGKKELFVPYNCYKAMYCPEVEQLFGTKHWNPDLVRWELHRMWIVEATLKSGKRHMYQKRYIYIDEDSWHAVTSENYDAKGFLCKVNFAPQTPHYDRAVPYSLGSFYYNMVSNIYTGDYLTIAGGYVRQAKLRPQRYWTPANIAAGGVR